jgi:Putative Ig domain
MRFPIRSSALILMLALCFGPGDTLRAAPPPGVQWVADVTPDPSQGYPVNSVYRLADGTVLLLQSKFFQGVTASHLDSAGAVLSTRELMLPDIFDGSLTLSVDSFGAVFAGLTVASRAREAWVMKFDGLTGRPLWPGPFHYRPDPLTETFIRSLALDAHGNLFVTGFSSLQSPIPFLFRLDGATGGVLWGPVSHVDPSTPGLTFTRVSADAKGDAVVSGSWSDGTIGQIEAFKFDGLTGGLLWGPTVVPAGATGPDFVRFAALDARGDLVIAGQRGQSLQLVVSKIAGADGSILWGPRVFVDGTGNSFDFLLLFDAQSDVLLGASVPGGTVVDVPTLLKVSGQDGAVVWGPIPYPGDPSALANPVAAVVEPNGDLVVTFSERKSGPVTRSAVTVRVNGATGAVLWGPAVLPSAGATGGLLLDPGGSLLLATSTIAIDSSVSSQVVFYLGATGETIRGPLDLPPTARFASAVGVAADANGDVVTLGTLIRPGSARAVLVKYRGTTGSVAWGPVEMPEDVWGSPVDLKLAANGDPIWIGTRQKEVFGTTDIVLSRRSVLDGSLVWGPMSFTSGIPNGSDRAAALALDGNGNVFVLGESSGNALFTLKYDGTTGGILWGPAFLVGFGVPTGLAVALTGDVAVAGWTGGTSVVVQYRGSTGTLAWGPVSPPVGFTPQAIGMDPSGDVILAGSTVMKLRGVDGSTAWGPVTLPDPVGGFISSAALAFDSAGNPVVGAFTFDGATSRRADFFAKFDNATGGRLWGPAVWDASEGPAPEDLSLAIDSAGDVVAAASGMNDSYQDMVLRKYSGADGSPVWGPVTFDGPGTNFLRSLALVGKDPVLAGSSSSGTMRTVRFGSALSLETQAWQIPPALCGQPYSFAFQTRNGAPPIAFAITGGALPAGLFLDPATGVLSGSAGPAGTYSFRLRVGSGVAGVERDFTMIVVEGQPVIDVAASSSVLCAGGSAVLSVPGAFSSYLWLPGGEATPTLTVSPSSTTTYDFVGTTAGGCIQRGSRTLTVLPVPGLPAISAPSSVPALAGNLLASVADHPGSHYVWSIAGGGIVSGQGTHEIRFGAGVGGDLALTVVETTGSGCRTPAASFTFQVTPAATMFFPVPPCRIYDSRTANLPFAAGEVRRLTLAGLCGLPPTARAVAMNVTAIGVSGGGSLSVAPGGIAGAAAGGPTWKNRQTRAASTIMGVDAAGAVDVTCQAASGAAHLVIDVAGYFE